MTGSAENTSDAIDAWTYALDLSRPYFTAPAAREPPIEFAVEAKRIGMVVRQHHETVPGDENPDEGGHEAALPDDLDAWVEHARAAVDSGLTLLERQLSTASFPQTRVAEAQALVRRRAAYLGRIDELADSLGDDLGVRIHARRNLALSDVSRSSTGTFAIVAESENKAPGDELASPLRDVASMLRSFSYASATLTASVEKTSDMPTRELRAARWERDVRANFLEGYLASPDDDAPGILPEEPESVSALIALFETDRAFFDLSNELTNRPSWAWIPMRGIAKLLTR
ncbi:MAG: hypothetical protein ABI442_11720 [Gemmatimonadaceae bacterium]